MNKIKKILVGLMAMPIIALGVTAIVPAGTALAGDCVDGYNVKTGAQCTQTDDQPSDLVAVFQNIANVLLFIIGALSVIMIIYGGIRYTTSGGNSSAVTAAKNTIMYAVIGVIVAILAFAIVNFVINVLIRQ